MQDRGVETLLVYFREGYDRLTSRFPGRVMEWVNSAILSTCGWVLLIQSPALFERPYFQSMSEMASQHVWGAAAMLIGLIRIVFLTINGTMPRTSSYLRAMGAFLALFFWFSLCLGMAQADIVGFGMAVYPWLFLADVYSLHRASTDMRLADNKAKESRRVRSMEGGAASA